MLVGMAARDDLDTLINDLAEDDHGIELRIAGRVDTPRTR